MTRNWWYAFDDRGQLIGHFDAEDRAQRWAAVWNEANGSDGAYVEKNERDELALAMRQNFSGWMGPVVSYGIADAILAAGYRKEPADGIMVDRLQAAVSAVLALAQEWKDDRANLERTYDYSHDRLDVLDDAAQEIRDAIGSALRGQA